jgi:hypothetical protein
VSTVELERHLLDLASALEEPTIDVTSTVRARIEAGEGRAPARRRRWFSLGALIAALGMVIFPGPRTAIADWLGLDGVEIRTDQRGATTAPPRQPDDLGFGIEVSVADATLALGRDPLLPPGRPDAIFLAGAHPTFQYADLYLTQFVSGPDQPWVIGKLLPPGDHVRSVVVNGGRGYWIEGPHAVNFGTESPRAVGDVLLWEQDGLTLRLEGAASMTAALEFAGTLRA